MEEHEKVWWYKNMFGISRIILFLIENQILEEGLEYEDVHHVAEQVHKAIHMEKMLR